MGSKRYFKVSEDSVIRVSDTKHSIVRLGSMDYDRIDEGSTPKLRDDVPS